VSPALDIRCLAEYAKEEIRRHAMGTGKMVLSADRELLDKAKQMAEKRNTTVSEMFARFLQALTDLEGGPHEALGPITRRAAGLVTLPEDRSDKELVADALAEK
jgi:hypothetical protein